jgi:RHS repeat-associated protein
MRIPFLLLVLSGLASAQCYQFSAPGVTYTMDVQRINSGTTSANLTNLVVSQASTLVVNGTRYVAPVAPANLIFADSTGVSLVEIGFSQVLASPVWGVTIALTGMLDFLPSGVPAAIPPISSWQLATPTMGVQIAGGAQVKYTITAISSCIPGGGTSAFDLGKMLGDAIYQIGCVLCGEPINIVTGNVFKEENDYETTGSHRLRLQRYYNSASTGVGTLASSLGKNWRTNFDRYLNLSAGKAIAERPDGRRITFTQSGTSWTTDSDVGITLANSGSTWTLTDETDNVETYKTQSSTQGLLQTIVARGGYTQTLAYNSANQVISVTDSFNRALTFQYSTDKLATVATPDNTITFAFDSTTGVLASVSYSTQPVTARKYVYENSSLPAALTGIVDENGARYLSWTYDSNGRALTSQHSGGADLTTVAYNDTDGSRAVTNALGQQETYNFTTLQNVSKVNEVHRQASSTVPAATMKYTYDSNGYVASRTDWNGITTNYLHDSRGLVTSITDAAGTPQQRVVTVTHHPAYRIPAQISMPGLNASFTYDSAGQPLTFTLTDTALNRSRTWIYTWSNFLMQSVKGPRTDLSEVMQLTYDSSGALTSLTNALNQVTRIIKHTAGGLPQTIIDPNGVTANVNFDSRQRVISTSIVTVAAPATAGLNRDAAGNITAISLPNGATISNSFDGAHRLTGSSDSLGNSIAYVLDAVGGRAQVTTNDQSASTQLKRTGTFDSQGRVLKMLGGVNQVTAYTYDANGNALTITNPLNRVTTRTFDALNRISKRTDAAGGVTAFTYDAFHRPLTVTDPNGGTTTYVYNGFGETTQETNPASGTTTYVRDSAGNQIQKTDGRGAIANYSYDALNRLIAVTYPGNPAENITCKYDESGHGFGIGRLTSITDAAGTLSRSYDERGNIVSESRIHGAVTLTTNYTYDLASRIKSIQYPSKWTVAYSRDSMGRISAVTATSPGGASHPIVSGIGYRPFGPSVALTYGNGIAESREFDQDYRLTSISGGVEKLGYSYDAAGNVLGITDGNNQTSTQSLGYDSLNRLASASGAYGNLAYSYDANGNRLTDNSTSDGLGQMSALSYNQAGFLATVSSNQQQLTQYTYDAAGLRIVKSGAATGTTLYQYGPSNRLLEESDGAGSPQVDYIYLGGRPVAAIQANGSIYYLHTDRLGTPLAATDAAQSIAWTASYQPFGALSNSPAVIAQNLRLPGQEFDLETGIYHNGFRDYAPGLGRYLRSDPMGLPGGINTYAYVANNPLSGIDLWGLCNSTTVDDFGEDPGLHPIVPQLSEAAQLALSDAVDSLEQPLVAQWNSVNRFDWGGFGLGLVDTFNGLLASEAAKGLGTALTNAEELALGSFAVGSTLINTVADFAKAEAGQGWLTVARDLATGGLAIGTGAVLAPLLASAGLGTGAVLGITALGTAAVQWFANHSANLALGITPPN